ncbi:replication restart DNA helicase PriA [Leptothermofonsia sp. ETS-13]|uniref:replication restart DNA helicase PriA n=1 Tax=Leptothermofonsia sp. ETS-13 TaxID=3035696 RepID=UPI003BA20FEC
MKTLQNLVDTKMFSTHVVDAATVIEVCCPNCGSCAERHHLESEHLIRTQCPTCDYLMITCSQTGKVIEAYAPGIFAR